MHLLVHILQVTCIICFTYFIIALLFSSFIIQHRPGLLLVIVLESAALFSLTIYFFLVFLIFFHRIFFLFYPVSCFCKYSDFAVSLLNMHTRNITMLSNQFYFHMCKDKSIKQKHSKTVQHQLPHYKINRWKYI